MMFEASADVIQTDKYGRSPLFYAIRQSDNESVVRTLIDAGADFNITDNEGKTVLFYAVQQSNNKSVVRALIDAGADVNQTDKCGVTALFYAVQQRNNESVIRALIDTGADVNITNNAGETALFYAVQQSNNGSVVRALIDAGAGADINQTDKCGVTALSYAVQQSDNESVVRTLIDAGADVNITDNEGKTVLFYAVQQSNNKSVVRALIDAGAGADINQTDKCGVTALFYAVQQRNNESVVRALIDAGADVNITNGYWKSPLSYAVQQSDNESVVRALIDARADVNITDNEGKTALFYGVRGSDNESVVRALIDARADVNITDNKGKTALFYAVRQSDKESVGGELIDDDHVVNITYYKGKTFFYDLRLGDNESVTRALIEAGADVNITDNKGKTALFNAVKQYDNESVIRALIDAGADVNITKKYEVSPLLYAIEQRNNESVVGALIDAGADVNITNEYGKSPLSCAVQQSDNESVARALIDARADVNITDNNEVTALYYAVGQSDNESVVRALIDAGADVNKTNEYGKSPLSCAVQQSDNESVARALIDAHADVNITDNHEETALFYAVRQSDNESVVRALIDAGADVNITNEYGKSPLSYAVQESDNESVGSALIDPGADVNITDNEEETALFYAGQKMKNGSVVGALIDAGADVNITDNEGETALFYAVRLSDFYDECVVRALIDAGADVNITNNNGSSLLFCGVRGSDNESVVRALIDAGADVNSTDKEGRTASIEAVGRYRESVDPHILALLMSSGANPNLADSAGNTALHYATCLPYYHLIETSVIMEILSKLVSFGASMDLTNNQNQTPLLFCLSGSFSGFQTLPEKHHAVKSLVDVCKFLLENGSSAKGTSVGGESVFHLVLQHFPSFLKDFNGEDFFSKDALHQFMSLLKLFSNNYVLEYVTVNKRDVDLNTPLHKWACAAMNLTAHMYVMYNEYNTSKGHLFKNALKEILEHLLKCGARVNDRNAKEETPLHLCRTWTAVELLLDAGANPNDVDSSGRPPLLVAARNNSDKSPFYFYPDFLQEPKTFLKAALGKGLDLWKVDKHGESVLGILVRSERFVLAKLLIEFANEEKYFHSDGIAASLLNAICQDKSNNTYWKDNLVEIILKSGRYPFSREIKDTSLHFCCRNIIQKRHSSEEFTKTVHWIIAKRLLLYGADCTTPDAMVQTCLDIAESCPELKDLLLKPIDKNEVPLLIPWTFVSNTHKTKLERIARRQESKHVEPYWFHQDHLEAGSFGLVFAGINEKDGREVAIKRIEKLRMLRPEDKREITNLTALADCEQVVRYLCFFEDEYFSYIVLELLEGNLDEYLDSRYFDENIEVELCRDVITGLKYLHSKDIIHRDLKPGNILYKTQPKLCLKIADFGLSRQIDSTSTTVYGTHAGTRCWIAPEVLKSTKAHSKLSDVFSCGLVLYYILSGLRKSHPFVPADSSKKSLLEMSHDTEANILKGTRVKDWDSCLCLEASYLFESMLNSDNSKRPASAEALDHLLFWSKRKKTDFLIAVGNQEPEFTCPRAKRTLPSSSVEIDVQASFGNIVSLPNWNDPGFVHMPLLYTEMTKRRKYDTRSVVELVRFIRNAYAHVTELSQRNLLLEDFVFLKYFPNLVMEVYKAVTTHGWDKKRDEIISVIRDALKER